MDPLSATATIVGLAASLVTLVDLAVESSKLLHRLRSSLRDAPAEILDLCRRLVEVEGVLRELQAQAGEGDRLFSPSIRTLLSASTAALQLDLEKLHTRVRKLKAPLEPAGGHGKLVGTRIRYLIRQDEIKEHERRLGAHLMQLSLILALSNSRKFLLPFGTVLVVSNIADHAPTGSSSRIRYHFVPPRWLGNTSLEWDFRLQQVQGQWPSLSAGLTPITYNPHPELRSAVKKFDAEKLRGLMRHGLVRPSDYALIDKRPVTLLAAIAERAQGQPVEKVLKMYELVLQSCEEAVNPRSTSAIRSAAAAFVRNGGSLFWETSASCSILTLLMRHGDGFSVLEDCLFHQSEPWAVEELVPINRWDIGALSHSSPRFKGALTHYLDSFRSVFAQSANDGLMGALEISTLASEIASAPFKHRIEFYKGLNINERRSNFASPSLRLSYLSKAVKWGNEETFQALLNAGACPTQALLLLSRHQRDVEPALYAVRKKMVLALVDMVSLEAIDGDHETLLSLLLRSDEVRQYSSAAADSLIQRFILCPQGALDPQLPSPLLHTYLFLAVVLDQPHLLRELTKFHGLGKALAQKIPPLLDSQRVVIRSNFTQTSTYLDVAVALGSTATLQCCLNMLEPSAEASRAVLDAYDSAIAHAKRKYPRLGYPGKIWPCQPRQHSISSDVDVEICTAILDALRDMGLEPRGKETSQEVQPRKRSRYRVASRRLWKTIVALWRLTILEALLLRVVLAASLVVTLAFATGELGMRIVH
ncbi:hypothetical protein GQ53DRAFT_770994 [Thozetella sp. PMI_491]|nr:hypothetical protein GQ53DRAFT_770994 [Thozetella sp. PMI_491]